MEDPLEVIGIRAAGPQPEVAPNHDHLVPGRVAPNAGSGRSEAMLRLHGDVRQHGGRHGALRLGGLDQANDRADPDDGEKRGRRRARLVPPNIPAMFALAERDDGLTFG